MEQLKALAELATPNKDAMLADANAIHEVATQLVIDNDVMYEHAGLELSAINAKLAALEDRRLSITRPMDAAKKAVMSLFAPATERLEAAKKALTAGMLTYQRQKQEAAAEAQRRANEAAEKERARLAQRAERAEASGKADKAEALREQAMTTVAPVVAISQAKAKGVSTRANWQFEVTDPSLIPREFLMVDEKKIGQVVKAMKGDTNIPGIRVWDAGTVVARKSA